MGQTSSNPRLVHLNLSGNQEKKMEVLEGKFSYLIYFCVQPLHVGFTGDLGGNSIIVRWYRRKTNLHHVGCEFLLDINLFWSHSFWITK